MRLSAVLFWAVSIFLITNLAVVSPAAADDAATCRQGSDNEAIAACTRIIQNLGISAENRAIAYGNRCTHYNNKREPDRAIADCSEGIRLDPKLALAYYNRGIAYFIKEKFDRAITDFDEAIRLDPKLRQARQIRRYAYFFKTISDWMLSHDRTDMYQPAIERDLKGDADGAIEAFSIYLKKHPDDGLAHFFRGTNYKKLGQPDLAIADFNEALRLQPNENMYLINRAEAYAAKADYDDAIVDFTNAIGADPANFNLFYLRGKTYLHASRFEASLADFEAFLSHDANNKYAAKGRDCAMQRTIEGKCRSLPDNPDPELEDLIEIGARKFFPY